MRIRLRHVVRTRSGKRAVQEERIDADVLTIGRGTDNRLQIPGLGVPLHHAAVYDRADGIHIEPREASPLTINGHLVQGDRRLRRGDVIAVDQYEVRVLAPEPDERLALEIERVRYDMAETDALRARSRIGVERRLFTRRKLSWVALGAVALFAFGLPLRASRRAPPVPAPVPAPVPPAPERDVDAVARLSWATGPLTRAHSFTATRCSACHAVPFAPVRDQECQACHGTVGAHVAPGKAEPALFRETRCGTCHREHRGEERLVERTDAACTVCHADIRRQMADTPLRNVSRFTDDDRHPEFQILVPVAAGAAACERLPIAAGAAPPPDVPPREEPLLLRAGLRFAHAVHLQKGLRTKWTEQRQSQTVSLACPDCHVPDAGGSLMRPITFREHCQSCHDLAFSDATPERQITHPARPAAVEAELFQFYAGRALAGDRAGLGAEPARRRPGPVLTEPGRLDALAWARQQAALAKDDLLGKHGIDAKSGNRGACAVCHALTADGTDVIPVRLASAPGRCRPEPATRVAERPGGRLGTEGSRWMAFTAFSHEVHRSTRCEDCHRVERAATSPTGMLPGREACVRCHRHGPMTARGTLDACIQCHAMHVERFGPMHANGSPAT